MNLYGYRVHAGSSNRFAVVVQVITEGKSFESCLSVDELGSVTSRSTKMERLHDAGTKMVQ